MSNGVKYVTWTGLGIIVTIILFMISGLGAMVTMSFKDMSEIKEIVYRVDERTQILDKINNPVENVQANIVNPYKALEDDRMSLDKFTENLEEAIKNKEIKEE